MFFIRSRRDAKKFFFTFGHPFMRGPSENEAGGDRAGRVKPIEPFKPLFLARAFSTVLETQFPFRVRGKEN